VPEKAIVPFMVNAFDYVTFIHMLNSKMVVKFLTKLVGCVKKKSTLYEIFGFFRFLIKKLLL
jgi:hypothetical protein